MKAVRRAVVAALAGAVMLTAAPMARQASARPSRIRAIMYSLVVPGAGHWYMGRTTRAQVFAAAEVGVWTTYTTLRIQGHNRKEDYIEMAEVMAGVGDAHDRPDDYYRSLSFYQSSDDYNMIEVKAYARYIYPDDRAARDAYIQENLITGDATWKWTSEDWWRAYRLRRADSQSSYRTSRQVMAVALLNRLVAAVDAARLSVKEPKGSGDAAPAGSGGMLTESGGPALNFGLTESGVPYAALTARF
jgi:hypothetical protein